MKKKFLATLAFSLLVFVLAGVPAAPAKPNEYKLIVKHLKTRYQAKKVKVPFLWLARFAVKVARPAGVKSFSLTLFDGLKVSGEALDAEMQQVLRNSFSQEWIPIFRARSRGGQQAYMYMREFGNSVKITLVTIEKEQAAVIRATFNPEKLAEFINNPKIFGISLDESRRETREIEKPKEEAAAEVKTPESKEE